MNTPSKEQMFEALNKATAEQVVTSMQKAIRFRMAQRYIETLEVSLNEKQLHKMLDFLIDFQIFLDSND